MAIFLYILALLNFILWLINIYQVYADVPGNLKYFNAVLNLIVAGICYWSGRLWQ